MVSGFPGHGCLRCGDHKKSLGALSLLLYLVGLILQCSLHRTCLFLDFFLFVFLIVEMMNMCSGPVCSVCIVPCALVTTEALLGSQHTVVAMRELCLPASKFTTAYQIMYPMKSMIDYWSHVCGSTGHSCGECRFQS